MNNSAQSHKKQDSLLEADQAGTTTDSATTPTALEKLSDGANILKRLFRGPSVTQSAANNDKLPLKENRIEQPPVPQRQTKLSSSIEMLTLPTRGSAVLRQQQSLEKLIREFGGVALAKDEVTKIGARAYSYTTDGRVVVDVNLVSPEGAAIPVGKFAFKRMPDSSIQQFVQGISRQFFKDQPVGTQVQYRSGHNGIGTAHNPPRTSIA